MTSMSHPATTDTARRKRKRERRVSELLLGSLTLSDEAEVSVEDLIDSLKDRAFGLVLLLFALPNCVPIPPGLASLIGLPLIFFGLQLALGSPQPWLPRFISSRKINRSHLIEVIKRANVVLRRLERICQPRLVAITGPRSERVIGLAVLVFGLSIAIPLPFTNFVPALGIAIIALGLLTKDGVAVILGLLTGVFGLAVTGGVLASVVASLGFLTGYLSF